MHDSRRIGLIRDIRPPLCMNFSSSNADNSFAREGGGTGDTHPPMQVLGFPESFQRTAPLKSDEGAMSDATSKSTPLEMNSVVSSHEAPQATERGIPIPRRFSRTNVMRLENILNDVSISQDSETRARSLSPLPLQTEHNFVEPYPISLAARSQSPDGSTIKKKKVKMHRCPECHKDFPRPSGLRTHMNIHTKEKPFNCSYPGCERTFSVVSNAKRHMRTHGMGVSPDDAESVSAPYVVGFEPPVIVPAPDMGDTAKRKEPLKLRWPSMPTELKRASLLTPSPPSSSSFIGRRFSLSKKRVSPPSSLDANVVEEEAAKEF